MKRPEKVRVLGKDFRIVYITELDDFGHMKMERLEICIRDNLPKALEQDTMVHEVIHAISDQLDLELTEKQVNNLGCAIMQVLADNPDLAKYLR